MKKNKNQKRANLLIYSVSFLMIIIGLTYQSYRDKLWDKAPKKYTLGRINSIVEIRSSGLDYYYFVDNIKYEGRTVPVPSWARGSLRPQIKFIVQYDIRKPDDSRLLYKYKVHYSNKLSGKSWDKIPYKLLDNEWLKRFHDK